MLLRKTPLLLLASIIGFTSCKKANVTPINKNNGKDLVLTATDQQKVTADNAFTLKLFRNLDSANTGNANLFASPLSVSFALGMTSNGANGQTLAAFKNTLNFNGATNDQINKYYNNLITNLPQLDPNTTINIANSIWYRQGFSVLPQFLQTDSTYFHAKIQSIDFNSAASLSTINNWVSTQTNGKIPSIVNQILGNAEMYLVNAIYFKSTWKESFDPKKTSNQPFYLADNSQVQSSFMTSVIDFNYYGDGKADVYELPYSNNKYSMVIIMPAAGTSVHDLIAGLDSTKWQSWIAGLKPVNSIISLPKFKFSYSIKLNNALTALGLGIAFSDVADFSLINPTVPLKISEVDHKAYIETDESGTTAAAATSVGMITSIALPAFTTNINRPFLFAIRETSSGLLLFTGTVYNPNLSTP
jgi:serpin B